MAAPDAPQDGPMVNQFMENDDDASLNAWKESLLGDAKNPAASPADDPRRVIPKEFKVIVHNGPTMAYDLQSEASLNELKKKGYVLKEGQVFHYAVSFLVHHDLVIGLKLKTKTKKMLSSREEVLEIGSYPPTVAMISQDLEECEVPTGGATRGGYKVSASFVDQTGATHMKFDMKFKIEKA